MKIVELQKPKGVWCAHRSGEKGCAIHGSHPPSCQMFACEWLRHPSMPRKFRPDQSKVVLTHDPEGMRLIAHCDLNNPLAWRREPIYSLLKDQAARTWASHFAVIAKAGIRLWLVTPKSDIDLGEIDDYMPYQVFKSADYTAYVKLVESVAAEADAGDQPVLA